LRMTKTPPITSTMMPQMTPIQTALLSLSLDDDPCGFASNMGGLVTLPAFRVTGSAVDVEVPEVLLVSLDVDELVDWVSVVNCLPLAKTCP